MTLIHKMATDLSEFLHEDYAAVLVRLEREIFNKGSTVAEAWNKYSPKTQEEIMDFYSTTDAYIYDLLVDHQGFFRKLVQDRIIKRLLYHQAKRVLDFGGGIGLDSIAICKAGMDVTYFEVEGRTSQYANWMFQREGCQIKTITNISAIKHDAYDAVICMEVLEHVSDPIQVIEDISNYLKLGGIVLISESFIDTGTHNPTHLERNKRYAGKIFSMLERHGFILTMRPPDEKPLEFYKTNRDMRFLYSIIMRRLEVGRDLIKKACKYASKLS